MSKVTLNTIGGGHGSVSELNTNFDTIETAFDNTLSRDGTSPNQMEAQLDMNSNRVINLGAPSNANDAVRLVDLSDSDDTGAASAQLRMDLASTTVSEGASLVGVEDSAGNFSGADVESVLAELADAIPKSFDGQMDRFRDATHADELFTLPTGVNEFSLRYYDGIYHLFYDTKTQTKHRQAATIAGMSAAADDLTMAGRYPDALLIDGVWHLWVWISGTLTTDHYTAPTVTGPYTLQDSMPLNKADVKVEWNPEDEKYYAGYKELAAGDDHRKAGILVADDPGGPWTHVCYPFDDIGRDYWHAYEEADPHVFFAEKRAYLAFSGFPPGGSTLYQRIGLVELDPTTFMAITPAIQLVEPLEPWQQANGQTKVFSPHFLRLTGDEQKDRIFYSQNPSAAAVAGWSYIEAGTVRGDIRSKQIIEMAFPRRRNIARNIRCTYHGVFSFSGTGVVFTSSTGGIYGDSPINTVTDFTAIVEFTPSALPAAGQSGRLFSLALQIDNESVIGMWALDTGQLYVEIKHDPGTNDVTLSSGAGTIAANTRYRAVLRRLGDAVGLWMDYSSVGTATKSEPIAGLGEMRIGNKKGEVAVAGQQFEGTIHDVKFFHEALPISSF